MFSIFQKKKEVSLTSCVTGTQIPISEVKDEVFSSKMMGEGVAFQLEEGCIYAPCDATVSLIPSTLHAIGLQAENGTEILIHVGLDTVALEGKGFECLIKQGSHVKRGDCLLHVDLVELAKKGIDVTTMMVITNSNEIDVDVINNQQVTKASNVMICKKT